MLSAAPAAAQQRPLPELQSFLQQARARLRPDALLQSAYVFTETRRDMQLDEAGRTTRETLNVYESYPGLPGRPRWKRQTVKNGRPVSTGELERADRSRRDHVLKYAAGLARETASDRAAADRRREKDRLENEAAIDELLRVYAFDIVRREAVNGHDTIVLSFTPRPGVPARTKEGRLLRHFAGTAWISESEHELVRVEIEAIDTVSLGLGLFARIHRGSRLAFERRKVNGEEWLPALASYTVSARMLLVKRLRSRALIEFSDYRRFSVATETITQPPVDPG